MSTHKLVPTALAAGFALIVAIPVAAKPTPKPKMKTPTAHATTVKPSTAHGPKTTTVKTHGTSATAHGPKSTPKVKTQTTAGTAHTSKGQAKAVKPTKGTAKTQAKTSGSSAKSKSMTTDRTSGSAGRAAGDTTPTIAGDIPPTQPVKLSKAQQQLQKNDHLRLKLLDRLPPNTKVIPAAAGFKNLGQFVSAVNVSHNQGIDFFALKALMVGPHSMSLGQAIQQVKGVDATTARRLAGDATASADVDIHAGAGATAGTGATAGAGASTAADTATVTKTKRKGHN